MEHFGIGAGLAAIGFWGFIAACVWAGVWDSSRKRQARHETIRKMIESEKRIDEAAIQRIFGPEKRMDRELKVGGLITAAVAPGLVIMAFLISMLNEQAFYPIIGAAAIVVCVSAGLLLASKYVERSYNEDQSSSLGGPSV